jgi:hypothetical protein
VSKIYSTDHNPLPKTIYFKGTPQAKSETLTTQKFSDASKTSHFTYNVITTTSKNLDYLLVKLQGSTLDNAETVKFVCYCYPAIIIIVVTILNVICIRVPARGGAVI